MLAEYPQKGKALITWPGVRLVLTMRTGGYLKSEPRFITNLQILTWWEVGLEKPIIEHAHAILRKLGAEGPDGFLREEASAARELARGTAAAAAPVMQCECVRVHAGAGWPFNRPPAASWANRPNQYLRGAFALVERIGTSNQYEGRQSWTNDEMHEMSFRLDDGTD